ncbi:Dyp-type peroxidase [Gulosibacter sp. 10]|uniref:Dyp-type peroxidase n=1 Tax=Gulosibacter sp. 10 TaxID=1255570 RepID=UPI00097EFE36|nr:Dyp-type peroxidase [Gulosibacter sp. 10]SJM62261.1 Putative Dyp-type peroxidase, associated with bacterial analog of Cox17 protein [Gulosibacter sp. 10]
MAGRHEGPRRRDVLVGAAGVGVGAAVVLAGGAAVRQQAGPEPFGAERTPGEDGHQPGLRTDPPAHAVHIAVDLDERVDRERIRSLLRILTDDASRLMAGYAPIGDQEPQMAEVPAGLAITIGFGRGLVRRVDEDGAPDWLAPLPAFSVDRLEERWSGGDLLLLVACDDPLTLAHAQRMLLKDVRAFGRIRWQQPGFRNARGSLAPGTTQRNLFGQIDGTANPLPGTEEFDELVWISEGPAWLLGGTSFVLRRIRMDLETWDEVDLPGREAAVGRRLDTGAPLTGAQERDEPDFEAVTAQGFTVINPVSHLRRARSEDPRERFHRVAYNYDHPVADAGGAGAEVSDSGLLFGAYQADPVAQFAPVQQRLAEADLLNEWTAPVGSAVFAIPPAAPPGGFVGEQLFAEG